jgi:hypothetical protein
MLGEASTTEITRNKDAIQTQFYAQKTIGQQQN